MPAYGTSKAALNFLTCDWAKDLKPKGFIVIALYPGVNQLSGPHLSNLVGPNARCTNWADDYRRERHWNSGCYIQSERK